VLWRADDGTVVTWQMDGAADPGSSTHHRPLWVV